VKLKDLQGFFFLKNKCHYDTGYLRGTSKPKPNTYCTSEEIQDPHKYYGIPRESINLKA
jgi:hypothetical protein